MRTAIWVAFAFMALAPGRKACLLAQPVAPKATLEGHRGSVRCLALSPDGRTLASSDWHIEPVAAGPLPGEVRLWDMPSGKAQKTLDGLDGPVSGLAFAPDGKTLAVAVGKGKEGTIVLWDTTTGRRRRIFGAHAEANVSLAFAPDGAFLASAGSDGVVKLWETRTWTRARTVGKTGSSAQPALGFSPNGKLLAVAADAVQLWALPPRKSRWGLSGDCRSALFTSDGKTLAVASASKEIELWEVATRKLRASLKGHSKRVQGLAVTADSKMLVSVDPSGEVLLWDLSTGKECGVLATDSDFSAGPVAITADGKTLLTGGYDGAVRLWDVRPLRRRYEQMQAWMNAPPAVSAQEAAEIRTRIAALATVSTPEFGLSRTHRDQAFAPVAGLQQVGLRRLRDRQIKPCPAVLDVVRLGPKAIPFLLHALNDRRSTKLRLDTKMLPYIFFPTEEGTYRVTIGDVCYVVLGQIVGEDYSLVGYGIGTLPGSLHSATDDPQLHRQLRLTWASGDAPRHLYDKLMKDFRTRKKDVVKAVGAPTSDELQIEAVVRLLYYFPTQSVPIIAERLSRLNVGGAREYGEAWSNREESNGVRTVGFIEAVAWCKAPAIQKALRGIFERTTDAYVFAAALPAAEGFPKVWVRARIESFLATLPKEEYIPTGAGYPLLVALGKLTGKDVKPAFVRYFTNASLQRKWTMCHVLRETKGAWAIELLAPLLTDKRSDGYGGYFEAIPGQLASQLEVRLCDEAALTISAHNPDLRFTLAGKYTDLDRQIEVMRRQLARRK